MNITLSLSALAVTGVFGIVDNGARVGGDIVNTAAIQRTIDACAQAGGGWVVVPRGVYRTGALFFKPGVKLRLDDGAVLLGSDDETDYPLCETRIEGETCRYYPAMVNADRCDGFTITGKGVIDGHGFATWEEFWRRRDEMRKKTGNIDAFRNKDLMRPRVLYVSNSKNVDVSGVTFRNSKFWTTHFYQCEEVLVHDCSIIAEVTKDSRGRTLKGPSTDAVDIDKCRNFTVRGCRISVNDDGIVVKGGKGAWADDYAKHPENGPSSNILIEDCVFRTPTLACLTLGSECPEAHGVVMRNCRMEDVGDMLYLKMRTDTPQRYSDVLVENVTGSCNRFLHAGAWTQYANLGGRTPTELKSYATNVVIRNCRVTCRVERDVKEDPDVFELKGLELESNEIRAADGFVGFVPRWPEVTCEAKPWAYNWWMASAVDREGLEAQCAAMEEAGMGGFHVIPIYGAKGYESRYMKYLSPEWMRTFKDAVEIGAKHGLGVDMTMGNGWCFGGPQLKPEQGCWKLEKVADGQPPYVTWKLTGQQVKRAGPGGQGPMMDPFSPDAIDAFLAPYSVFDAPGAAKPLHVYHDSWEYFQAGWSPVLFDAFKAKRGYDLRNHLKELAGIGEREDVARIRCDYRETLSDLVIDDVFPRWVDWAHRRGIRVRNEAHGTCANWLDFYALADIPETEMFAAECRDILISKFASSAAHVTGKKLVASESCTWLMEHFTETLQDFKVFIDRLLLSGVNHMYYHGCCYSPVDAVWPGWCFYASSEMNPRNPIWRDAKYLNAYIARVQAMFQSCSPDNDTLVYWPLRDYWWEADGFERMMTLHSAAEWFHAQPIGAVARQLYAEGAAFDYVSDRQLQCLDLSRYAKVVVPPCRHMPEATKAAIAKFRERPVRIEPYGKAGLAYSRYRRGDETVYFIVNTNATRFVATLTPSAKGAKWWMDPMTGAVRPTDDCIELEPYASGFLVVKKSDSPLSSDNRTIEQSNNLTILPGPWTLTPVCGGPELPPVRTMQKLSTWSRNADGSESPFSGTMRYSTTFNLPNPPSTSTCLLDLGKVSQSAVVRINGQAAGFAIMAPYRMEFPSSLLKAGRNVLEVEVTSTGANRIRWNDMHGVNWKYFTDANMVAYGYKGQLDASKWPLAEYGLFGPVRLLGKGNGRK